MVGTQVAPVDEHECNKIVMQTSACGMFCSQTCATTLAKRFNMDLSARALRRTQARLELRPDHRAKPVRSPEVRVSVRVCVQVDSR